MCQWQDVNFYPYKLSDLKFTPLPSLHVDLSSATCCYLVILFVNCPLLIPLYNSSSLINVGFLLINVDKLCLPLSKLDLPTLRKGSTEERTQYMHIDKDIYSIYGIVCIHSSYKSKQ